MQNKDYIPTSDAKFNQWQGVLADNVKANATRYGLTSEDLTPLLDKRVIWEHAYAASQNPATATKAATETKNEASAAYKSALRSFVKEHLTYSSKVTNADRDNMGLPIHDTKPTRAPVPKTRPEVEVKFGQQLEHVLRVYDSVQNGLGKPDHVAGFEIFRHVANLDAPQPTVEQMQLVVQAPHSPHTLTYPSTDQGKRVYYAMRWVNTRGETGPWSEIVSAIVA